MIAFHYQDAMNQANELSRASDDLVILLNGILKQQQMELSCAWQGDSANLFLKKTEEVYGDIYKTAKLLAGISKSVSTSAKAIKKAEDAAKELIRR